MTTSEPSHPTTLIPYSSTSKPTASATRTSMTSDSQSSSTLSRPFVTSSFDSQLSSLSSNNSNASLRPVTLQNRDILKSTLPSLINALVSTSKPTSLTQSEASSDHIFIPSLSSKAVTMKRSTWNCTSSSSYLSSLGLDDSNVSTRTVTSKDSDNFKTPLSSLIDTLGSTTSKPSILTQSEPSSGDILIPTANPSSKAITMKRSTWNFKPMSKLGESSIKILKSPTEHETSWFSTTFENTMKKAQPSPLPGITRINAATAITSEIGLSKSIDPNSVDMSNVSDKEYRTLPNSPVSDEEKSLTNQEFISE